MGDEREPVGHRPSSIVRRPSIARQSSSRVFEFEPADQAGPYSGAGTAADGGRSIVEVEVVPELCMSFLNCMRIATGAFGTDRATGRTRATQRWKKVDASKLWRAGWSCPTGAIRFVTDQGYVNPRWEEASRWSVGSHPAAGLRRDSAEEASKP
jgi:ferredoxin